jgi:hypothetical protein
MREETWVQFHENYFISNYGRVKNQKNQLLITRINTKDKAGLWVRCYDKGVESSFPIRILVAKHFLPNPNNYKHVNIKNGIFYEMNEDNLEWSEHCESKQAAYSRAKKVLRNGKKKKLWETLKRGVNNECNME